MRFTGQLLIPAEGGPGLPVDLEVEGRQLSVVTDSETLGVWPLDSIRVRRLAGDKFAMKVAGEDLHFVADDTISFAYDGISAIERRHGASRPRRPVLQGLKELFGRETIATTPTPADTSTDNAISDPGVIEIEEESLDLTDRTPEWETSSEDLPLVEETDEFENPESQDRLRQTSRFPEPSRAAQPAAAKADDLDPGTCKALRNDGLPCESPIVGQSGFCYPHDPSNPVGKTFQDAQDARSRLRNKRTRHLGRVYSKLDKALSQVERGEIDTDQAMAMAQLARTMCAILELDDGAESEEAPTERPGL